MIKRMRVQDVGIGQGYRTKETRKSIGNIKIVKMMIFLSYVKMHFST